LTLRASKGPVGVAQGKGIPVSRDEYSRFHLAVVSGTHSPFPFR
jgi:hypothetical protein